MLSIGCITQENREFFGRNTLGIENCPFLFKNVKINEITVLLNEITVLLCFKSPVVLVWIILHEGYSNCVPIL